MGFPKDAMQTLWAPWRVEYYETKEQAGNFLLLAAHGVDDVANLVLRRGKYAFVLMNRYPYATGHLMVVPYREVDDLAGLGGEEVAEVWAFAVLSQRVLRREVHAHGFNIGFNIGEAAGAGLAAHLHLHVVPRWRGDFNFMPVLGQTRIIPQGLEPLYAKLRAAFDAEPPLVEG